MSNVGVEKDRFGVTADGVPVDRYTLVGRGGTSLRLITYGAAVTELHVPDRDGRMDDVVLGFDRLEQYETESPYFGCVVGRVAFRITEGRFELDGKPYELTLNTGPHHLHGGVKGLSWVVWDAEPLDGETPAVKLTHRSPDGDQGYPGNLDLAIVYSLTDRNEMRIEYTATTDAPTPVNLSHHGYFNLAGAGSGDVWDHTLWLDADRYSVTDEAIIPTGELAPVEGTRFDFTRPTPLGARLERTGDTTAGYDLAYLLRRHEKETGTGPICRNGPENAPHKLDLSRFPRVATMHEPTTGRVMEVESNAPAVVLYTGEYLDGTLRGKGGTVYPRHAAFCLEPGHLPDSVHHPGFPSVILRPGETYRHTLVYRFSTQ